jgi:hypothetical protein
MRLEEILYSSPFGLRTLTLVPKDGVKKRLAIPRHAKSRMLLPHVSKLLIAGALSSKSIDAL